MEAIETISLRVALKKKKKTSRSSFQGNGRYQAQSFISSGQLSLKNIGFLVADDEKALHCEELLMGLSVLRHLRVDTKTSLERNIKSLNGTYCSFLDTGFIKTGELGRITRARLHLQLGETINASREPDLPLPKVNYNTSRTEEDPFPDSSLLDQIDSEQHEEIKQAVAEMEHVRSETDLQIFIYQNLKVIL